jgi:adhesin transport system membrane fusion protein
VKNIRVTTIGGVIQQGADIMEIVPLEDQLLVEAKIKPADVAFVRPGLPATVKVSAYDYAIYGGLHGTVEHLSPDTLKDDEKARAGRADATYYRILVRTDKAALSAGGKEFPIIPGMTATAEIRTGEKTILSYLLKPVLKAREAFRER